MSKFSQFLSKAMLKTAKKFDININDMQINVEDKTDELTEEQVKEIIIKENPTIYWSDDRAEHYIMDFPFEVDGKKYWCGSVKVSNDLKSMDVKIWTIEPKQANTLRNIVKSAATVKEIEEIAKGYEQDLQGLGYKDMKVEPYFAYGKYGFYFNFTREDGKPGQKFTGLDTKNNTKLNLRNAYYDLINRKNWYLKRQAKQATKCAKVTKKAEYGEHQGNHLLEYIGNLLSEGYASGADPVWDINITINNDSELFDELSYEAQDYIRNEISYPVKDGHLYYSDVEIWLSGDRAKEDFTEKDLMKIFTDEETVKTLLSDPNAEERFYVSYDLEVDEDELENNEL